MRPLVPSSMPAKNTWINLKMISAGGARYGDNVKNGKPGNHRAVHFVEFTRGIAEDLHNDSFKNFSKCLFLRNLSNSSGFL